MLLLSAALLMGMQTVSQPKVVLRISSKCGMRANGRKIPVGDLKTVADGWVRAGREVHVQPSPHASYDCVNDVISTLRDAGIVKLGFVGNEALAPEKPQ